MRILLFAALLLISGCQERNYYNPNSPSPTPIPPNGGGNPTPVTSTKIEFRVGGNIQSARIRFSNAVDGTSQVITTLPYNTTITTTESSMFLSLEATPISYSTGLYPFMSVQIFVNGVLFRESVSNDYFSTLSVSGTWRK